MPEASPEEVVRQAHEAVNDGDLEAFVACWTEDCEYRPSLEGDIEGEERVFRGHDGIRRWWQGMSEAWSEWHTEVHDVREASERVLVFITLRGRGRTSEAMIEAPFVHLATVRDGTIVASRDFSDREQALEAAGLSG
jgi:ketosteroid isomerase-like protein